MHRVGVGLHPLADFYHTLMRVSWPTTVGLVFGGLIAINLVFAIVFLVIGGVEGARPGNFQDCFFFSVQTFTTIGYGKMVPVTLAAHTVVMLEAFTGILVTALITGLVFARFSRPTARIVFSRNVLIAPYDGKRTLMFRLVNERSNRVVQANVRVSLLRMHKTIEGHTMRRLIDLKLQRSDSAMFAITWTVFHTLDESSPLFGATRESLAAERIGLVVTLIGVDETLSQTVNARHNWDGEQILFDRKFVDVLTDNPDGSRTLDLTKFHDTVPI